ncbi:MAG: enoyl-CoA hydratase/isomerase family protein, partial [Proteobacteria bacterium]|nr:enoyl-CoA hydratase/isomerase family protein [Pseudomonadota bacterium]
MSEFIDIKQHGNVVEVALNRPKAFNAFNLEMVADLARNLTRLAADDAVRGIALAGRGKAFCAGGDLNWALNHSEKPGS